MPRPTPAIAAPKLSVVYAPAERPDSLRRAAFAMQAACGAGCELVILYAGPTHSVGSLAGVRVVTAPEHADRRRLRELGAVAASGDVLVFTEHADDVAVRMRVAAVRRAAGIPITEDADVLGPVDGAARPMLSVVIPVRDGAATLDAVLSALDASDLPRRSWELVVVCDGCSDESAAIAARWADVVVRLPGDRASGPAYARNRGAEIARAEHLVFVDADVRVRPDTLRRLQETLVGEPTVAAVVGMYDDAPPSPGFVSQYRNLVNHWMQRQQDPAQAVFWSGCGAVRRSAFADAGGYDEWRFPAPQVEDAELTQRLRARGHAIRLRPDIVATHLKQWTLRRAIAADVRDVGAPWARLGGSGAVALRMGVPGHRTAGRWNSGLAWLGIAALLLAASGLARTPLLALALLATIGLVVRCRAQLGFLARQRGWVFALLAFPLEVLYFLASGAASLLGGLARELLGDTQPEPAIQALAEVGARTWPPIPVKRG
ncbi:MAG TPA: glycosyltransferase family A protein [Gemmatimonadaceae bacterium]|nr:glycosyltransferase family A protein [Gemmatimonadaceae bacterium]